MSEWVAVFAVFWAFWAVDGVRIFPRSLFSLVGGGRRRVARIAYGRLAIAGGWPGNWWAATADVPLSLSPLGICNRPIGGAGRPAENPEPLQSWRWADIRQVGTASGWLFVNEKPFCPDTGHLTGPELLKLAKFEPAAREKRIAWLLARWLRPAHLRRRATVLVGRTATATLLNVFSLGLLVAITAYVVIDAPARLPLEIATAVAYQLPLLLGYLLVLHITAVALAWSAARRLTPGRKSRRGTTLFTALMFPPQSLRLRAIVGEDFFPAQHPLAMALAFGRKELVAPWAFQALADLRWPIHGRDDPELAREITGWFGCELERKLGEALTRAQLAPGSLLVAPPANDSQSTSYCPRCHSQFVGGRKECPHGIALLPLARAVSSSVRTSR